MKIKLTIATALLILLSSCSKDYIYYKSHCACNEIINYADIKRV